MNKPITKLHKEPDKTISEFHHYMAFRVFFKPDINHENFEIGMMFHIVSVNRQTGEVCFSLDHCYHPPKEDND